MTDPDEITDDLYLIEILLRYCQPKEPQYKEARDEPAAVLPNRTTGAGI